MQSPGNRLFKRRTIPTKTPAEILHPLPVINGAADTAIDTQIPVGRIQIAQDNLPIAMQGRILQLDQFLLTEGGQARSFFILCQIMEGSMVGDFRNLTGITKNKEFILQNFSPLCNDHFFSEPMYAETSILDIITGAGQRYVKNYSLSSR